MSRDRVSPFRRASRSSWATRSFGIFEEAAASVGCACAIGPLYMDRRRCTTGPVNRKSISLCDVAVQAVEQRAAGGQPVLLEDAAHPGLACGDALVGLLPPRRASQSPLRRVPISP